MNRYNISYVPLTVLYAFVVFWCNKHYSISLHYTHNIVLLYSFHIKLNSKHFFYQYNKYIKTNWRISWSQIMKNVTHDQITSVHTSNYDWDRERYYLITFVIYLMLKITRLLATLLLSLSDYTIEYDITYTMYLIQSYNEFCLLTFS
jgi:hypothetical protein